MVWVKGRTQTLYCVQVVATDLEADAHCNDCDWKAEGPTSAHQAHMHTKRKGHHTTAFSVKGQSYKPIPATEVLDGWESVEPVQ